MPLVLFVSVALMVLGMVILDGFDMGVGMMLPFAPSNYRQALLASLAPWRSTNETWLLLTFGLTLAAFPFALSAVFTHLFIPLFCWMIGLVLRSIAFEYRVRSPLSLRSFWLTVYVVGSVLSALGIGSMLAAFASGYHQEAANLGFIFFVSLCVVAACILMGACWTFMRWEGEMRILAARLASHAVRWTAAGMTAVSIMLAMANPAILYKWMHIDNLLPAVMLWLVMLACFVWLDMRLKRIEQYQTQQHFWVPFVLCVVLLALMMLGILYSIFPYLVIDEVTLWDAAPSVWSMRLILSALIVVSPVIFLSHLSHFRSIFSPPGARP